MPSKDLSLPGKIWSIQSSQTKIILPGGQFSTSIQDGITITTVEMPSSAFLSTHSQVKWKHITSSFHNEYGNGSKLMEDYLH